MGKSRNTTPGIQYEKIKKKNTYKLRHIDLNKEVLVNKFSGEKLIKEKIIKKVGIAIYLVELPSGMV